jgi:hypothetical protein
VLCPLCGTRRARRGCPALGHQICAVCCGTKRLVQIQCPSDCAWLASAREHPPAVAVRQQQRDIGLLVQFMRDFSQHQSQLFLLINTFLVGYEPGDLLSLIDADVAEATAALAATFETAARGVIYEHRPASLPAERLTSALKAVLTEAGHGDVAVVLRRVAEAVSDVRALDQDNRRAFLDLLGRVITQTTGAGGSRKDGAGAEAERPEVSRLIVP